jgi:hypothetical protein
MKRDLHPFSKVSTKLDANDVQATVKPGRSRLDTLPPSIKRSGKLENNGIELPWPEDIRDRGESAD